MFLTSGADVHLSEVQAFLADMRRATDPDDKARYLKSAIESAVAFVEWFVSRFPGEKSKAGQILALADMYLPRYRLLRRIRVHDFHRNPLPSFPVTPERFMGICMQGLPGKFIGMQGPVRLSASGGSGATMSLTPNGLVFSTTGDGKVDLKIEGTEGPIVFSNDGILDESKGDWVHVDVAVDEFIGGAEQFVKAVSSALPDVLSAL